jgi:hypothetical protein
MLVLGTYDCATMLSLWLVGPPAFDETVSREARVFAAFLLALEVNLLGDLEVLDGDPKVLFYFDYPNLVGD